MSDDYRDLARGVHSDAWWTLRRFLPVTLVVIALVAAVAFGLHAVCVTGETAVERKAFENSYQRKAGIKARIANDEAALAEITRQLQNPNLDADTRTELEAQAAAIRVRLGAARRQK